MPETWDHLAADARAAAFELYEGGRWRSCASRAYYAIYAATTAALLRAGVNMSASRPNPNHRGLPMLVGSNLTALPTQRRWRLADIVGRAYTLRIIADYGPGSQCDRPEATVAMGFMTQAFTMLRDANA